MAFDFREGQAIHAALAFAMHNWPEFFALLSPHGPEVQLMLLARLRREHRRPSLLERIGSLIQRTAMFGTDRENFTAADLIVIQEALILAIRNWDDFVRFVSDRTWGYDDPDAILAAIGRSGPNHARLVKKIYAIWSAALQ